MTKKTVAHIGLSNTTDQWFTPPEIISLVHRVLGIITLDPCSSAEANKVVSANRYLTKEDNGVDADWAGNRVSTVFCNPPSGKYKGIMYPEMSGKVSNPVAFFRRLNEEYDHGYIDSFIYLGYSIEQIQTLQASGYFPTEGFSICFPSKRIRFVDQSGNRSSPTHANFLMCRGSDQSRFNRVFSGIGLVMTNT